VYCAAAIISALLFVLAYLGWQCHRERLVASMPPESTIRLLVKIAETDGWVGPPSEFNRYASHLLYGPSLAELLTNPTDYYSSLMSDGLISIMSVTDKGNRPDGTPDTTVIVELTPKGRNALRDAQSNLPAQRTRTRTPSGMASIRMIPFMLYYVLSGPLFVLLDRAAAQTISVSRDGWRSLLEGAAGGIVAALTALFSILGLRRCDLKSELAIAAPGWSRVSTFASVFFVMASACLSVPLRHFQNPLPVTMFSLIGIATATVVSRLWWKRRMAHASGRLGNPSPAACQGGHRRHTPWKRISGRRCGCMRGGPGRSAP
jgi:hypothetical protein